MSNPVRGGEKKRGGGGLISNSGDVIDKSPRHCEGREQSDNDREERAGGDGGWLVLAAFSSFFFVQPLPVLDIEKRLHSNNNSSN